jgi:hypothetical protein
MKRTAYSYAFFRTREHAEAYAEDMFASGLVSWSEFAGIEKLNGLWHVMLFEHAPE